MRKILVILLSVITLSLLPAGEAVPCLAPAAQAQARTSKKKAVSSSGKKTSGGSSTKKKAAKTGGGSQKKQASPASSADVRRQQQQARSEIRQTQKEITLNTRQTERQLNALAQVEGEIGECNRRIGTINSSLDSINRRTGAVADSITALNARLDRITRSYAAALRRTQGSRNQTSQMAFLLSAKSFAQAFRRLSAVKQFGKWRERKQAEIVSLRSVLQGRRNELDRLHAASARTARELSAEHATLRKKQTRTASLVDSLKERGAELNQIMAERTRQAAALDAELDRIVAREAAEAARREREAREAREKKERAEREARLARERAEAEAEKLLADARMLQEIGCFALVLEKIPAALARRVASELGIPVLGIGAGGGVDGQVLVMHDMLGINKGFSPKFLRRYADLSTAINQAVSHYIDDVKTSDFPNASEQY